LSLYWYFNVKNFYFVIIFKLWIVYLHKISTQSITADINSEYSGIENNVGDYEIVDCKKGICKKTSGFIKIFDAINTTIYKIINGGANGETVPGDIAINVKEDIDCNDDNTGMIFSDKSGICYMYGASLKFGVESKVHIIMGGTAVAGTPFANVDDGYPIKSGKDYIIVDPYIDESKEFRLK